MSDAADVVAPLPEEQSPPPPPPSLQDIADLTGSTYVTPQAGGYSPPVVSAAVVAPESTPAPVIEAPIPAAPVVFRPFVTGRVEMGEVDQALAAQAFAGMDARTQRSGQLLEELERGLEYPHEAWRLEPAANELATRGPSERVRMVDAAVMGLRRRTRHEDAIRLGEFAVDAADRFDGPEQASGLALRLGRALADHVEPAAAMRQLPRAVHSIIPSVRADGLSLLLAVLRSGAGTPDERMRFSREALAMTSDLPIDPATRAALAMTAQAGDRRGRGSEAAEMVSRGTEALSRGDLGGAADLERAVELEPSMAPHVMSVVVGAIASGQDNERLSSLTRHLIALADAAHQANEADIYSVAYARTQLERNPSLAADYLERGLTAREPTTVDMAIRVARELAEVCAHSGRAADRLRWLEQRLSQIGDMPQLTGLRREISRERAGAVLLAERDDIEATLDRMMQAPGDDEAVAVEAGRLHDALARHPDLAPAIADVYTRAAVTVRDPAVLQLIAPTLDAALARTRLEEPPHADALLLQLVDSRLATGGDVLALLEILVATHDCERRSEACERLISAAVTAPRDPRLRVVVERLLLAAEASGSSTEADGYSLALYARLGGRIDADVEMLLHRSLRPASPTRQDATAS